MWANSAAGVASWISEVVTLPVAKPCALASSRIVCLRLALDVDAERAVVGLGAGRPRRAAGRRVGDVVRACRPCSARSGVLARSAAGRRCPAKLPAGALRVVAGDGDLGVAHAVADQQDDVLRARRVDRLADGVGLIAVEPARAAGGAQVALRGAARAGVAAASPSARRCRTPPAAAPRRADDADDSRIPDSPSRVDSSVQLMYRLCD